jgi:plastocyanin
MQLKNIAVVLVSGLVFTGCSLLPGQTDKSNVPENDTTIQEESSDQGTETMLKEAQPQLNSSNFTFGVDTIKAKVGEKLVIKVTNDDGVHDFVIDELGVSSGKITEGDTMEITIPTDKPGTYEYYCSIGKHRDLGMVGTLIIE